MISSTAADEIEQLQLNIEGWRLTRRLRATFRGIRLRDGGSTSRLLGGRNHALGLENHEHQQICLVPL
jgi:hypothetical protein